jgi:ABC-type oligopeptide transport system ATPase subunit
VMHHGEIIEEGPTEQVIATPAHPVTQNMVSATRS